MGEQPISEKQGSVPGSNRERPVPVGATSRTRIEGGDRYSAPQIYNLDITVLKALRGKGAGAFVEAQGLSGEPLKAPFEYLVVLIRCGYSCKA
jgi:hypothetical protein